jgi:uncharacterized membrane protein
MGAQFSALKKDLEAITPKGADGWFRALHVAGHYAIVPAIYAFGLIHAGEFTWNPITLIDKVLVA